MTFKITYQDSNMKTLSNWFYDLKMKIYQSHLTDLMGIISIILITTLMLTFIAILFKEAKNNENKSKTKTFLEKQICGETLKTWVHVFLGGGTLLLVGIIVTISIYLGNNPYSFVNTNIISGTAIVGKDFGSQSNTEDLDLQDNKVSLHDLNETFLLATASRTHHTLTLTPASKTGKAYLRVLKYAKKHKNKIFEPNLIVALDKTTLTYKDLNGTQTIICYANNTNHANSTTNKTILHY